MTRLTVLFAAAAFSLVAAPVFAQTNPTGATVGPAGGVASTTAPSNSQGTPAGGTGTLSTTHFGPGGAVTAVPTPNTTPAASTHQTRRQRMAAHRAPRHPTEIGTQSQAGTNGAAPASK